MFLTACDWLKHLSLTCLILDDQRSGGGGGSAGSSSVHGFYSELIFSSLHINNKRVTSQ